MGRAGKRLGSAYPIHTGHPGFSGRYPPAHGRVLAGKRGTSLEACKCHWREELTEAVKTKAERDAEEQARQKKRVAEALATAEAAMALGADALR